MGPTDTTTGPDLRWPPRWMDRLTEAQKRGAWTLRERMRIADFLMRTDHRSAHAALLITEGDHWEYYPDDFEERWRKEVQRLVRK